MNKKEIVLLVVWWILIFFFMFVDLEVFELDFLEIAATGIVGTVIITALYFLGFFKKRK